VPFKASLILEGHRYGLQKALSDLAGVDVRCHSRKPENMVRVVRDWLVECSGVRSAHSPTDIWWRFTDFTSYFYALRKAETARSKKPKRVSARDLNMMPVPEYLEKIVDWIAHNPVG
jgi:hypothetical protein